MERDKNATPECISAELEFANHAISNNLFVRTSNERDDAFAFPITFFFALLLYDYDSSTPSSSVGRALSDAGARDFPTTREGGQNEHCVLFVHSE